MDKFGRKFVIVPGFALYATSLVVVAITALLDSPFVAFIAGYVMVQFTVGTIGGTMQVLGTDFSPAYARGRFFAIWRTLAQVGSTASPAVYAIVAEKVSYGAAFLTLSFFGYLVSFLVMAVLKVRPVREERVVASG